MIQRINLAEAYDEKEAERKARDWKNREMFPIVRNPPLYINVRGLEGK